MHKEGRRSCLSLLRLAWIMQCMEHLGGLTRRWVAACGDALS